MAFILAVTMFPQISIVSPLYLLLRSLHLIDTYPGLIMPYMTFAMPLTVWVLTGSIRQIPKDLEEAAHVDGASRRQSFTMSSHKRHTAGVYVTACVPRSGFARPLPTTWPTS